MSKDKEKKEKNYDPRDRPSTGSEYDSPRKHHRKAYYPTRNRKQFGAKPRITKLTCHECGVKEGYGRDIEVIGIYSICHCCWPRLKKQLDDAFDRPPF